MFFVPLWGQSALLNPLTTNVPTTGFYMIGTLVVKGLNHKVDAQKFREISFRLPVFSKRLKRVFEVYFRNPEFHQARTKRKMFISGLMFVIYGCYMWTFFLATWVWSWIGHMKQGLFVMIWNVINYFAFLLMCTIF